RRSPSWRARPPAERASRSRPEDPSRARRRTDGRGAPWSRAPPEWWSPRYVERSSIRTSIASWKLLADAGSRVGGLRWRRLDPGFAARGNERALLTGRPLAFLVRRTRCLQEPGGDESTGEKGRDEESWTLSRHVLEIGSHAVRVSIANPRAHAVEAVGEVIDPIGGVLFPLVPQPLGGVVRCSSDRANLVHRTVLIALESLNALIL